MSLYQILYVEVNFISLIILLVVIVQIYRNLDQQLTQNLFRYLLDCIALILIVDSAWVLVEGAHFKGARLLNFITNAAYLSLSAYIAYIWLLYVLKKFGHHLNLIQNVVVALPAVFLTIVCIASYWTGWTIHISKGNHYSWGPYHWLQVVIANGYLVISLFPLISEMIHGDNEYVTRPFLFKMLSFYIMPLVGTVINTLFPKIPTVWPLTICSLMIIYLGLQENAIETDGLTGLRSRKTLDESFLEQCRSLTGHQKLYLFILNLNRFRQINEQFGHIAGDDALVKAAGIIRSAIVGTSYYAARYGGGAFLIIARFNSREDAINFAYNVRKGIASTNEDPAQHYRLDVAIGYDVWDGTESLADLIESAETLLYKDKAAITW